MEEYVEAEQSIKTVDFNLPPTFIYKTSPRGKFK